MNIGIYIPGLGQSFQSETVEKYAERVKNEMSFATNGIEYELKVKKIVYSLNRESTLVSIIEKKSDGRVMYKLYDFKYHKIITEKYNSYSLISKKLCLFSLVFKKAPLIIKKAFFPENFNRQGQTLYLFTIFFIISLAILFMLPATISVLLSTFDSLKLNEYFTHTKRILHLGDIPLITKDGMQNFSKRIIAFTAIILLLVPKAKDLVSALATEFVCVNEYIELGVQKQVVQGNLELLIDYITENEENPKIHLHAYSFGSILALDYLFPFGNKVSKNAEIYCEALITIGNPFEFINAYYPKFFQNRKFDLENQLVWINVYAIADALGTNFRKDALIGDAEFGIESKSKKPININYEVAPLHQIGITDFIKLYSLKAHGNYWDPNIEGQSCVRLIYDEMHKNYLM